MEQGPRAWPRVLGAAEVAAGAVLLIRARHQVRYDAVNPLNHRLVLAARILGVRYAAQGTALAIYPCDTALRFAAGVDAVHGLSMGVAACSPRLRRSAIASGIMAAAFAALAVAACPQSIGEGTRSGRAA